MSQLYIIYTYTTIERAPRSRTALWSYTTEIYYSRYIMADILRADILQQICYGRYFTADILRQVRDGLHITAGI